MGRLREQLVDAGSEELPSLTAISSDSMASATRASRSCFDCQYPLSAFQLVVSSVDATYRWSHRPVTWRHQNGGERTDDSV
jgi:hypothetical protein